MRHATEHYLPCIISLLRICMERSKTFHMCLSYFLLRFTIVVVHPPAPGTGLRVTGCAAPQSPLDLLHHRRRRRHHHHYRNRRSYCHSLAIPACYADTMNGLS
jgi:hypothetical protein